MKTFGVFEHPTDGRREAVKDGFSWPGFFFKSGWAFFKGLPGRALIFLAVTVLVWVPDIIAGIDPSPIMSELTELSLSLWIGREGNEWRRKALARKGYRWIGTVEADSPQAALAAMSHQGTGTDELTAGSA
jgi:hypothetical protein